LQRPDTIVGDTEVTERQAWFDEAQKITCAFVQDDEKLGMLMLDGSPRYWDQSFEEGLTPQQALDRLVDRLSGGSR
jgi:hypothetical protein